MPWPTLLYGGDLKTFEEHRGSQPGLEPILPLSPTGRGQCRGAWGAPPGLGPRPQGCSTLPRLSSVWAQVPAPGWDHSGQDLPPSWGGGQEGCGWVSLFPGWLRLLCQRPGKKGKRAGHLGGSGTSHPAEKSPGLSCCVGAERDPCRSLWPGWWVHTRLRGWSGEVAWNKGAQLNEHVSAMVRPFWKQPTRNLIFT